MKVYYSRLNVRIFRETEDYNLVELISDFGAIAGICLGASVLTFTEFLYCLIGLICYVMSGSHMKLL